MYTVISSLRCSDASLGNESSVWAYKSPSILNIFNPYSIEIKFILTWRCIFRRIEQTVGLLSRSSHTEDHLPTGTISRVNCMTVSYLTMVLN